MYDDSAQPYQGPGFGGLVMVVLMAMAVFFMLNTWMERGGRLALQGTNSDDGKVTYLNIPSNGAQPAQASSDPMCWSKYTVQPGDSYESIAAGAGISTQQLAVWNPYVPVGTVFPGQELCTQADPSAGHAESGAWQAGAPGTSGGGPGSPPVLPAAGFGPPPSAPAQADISFPAADGNGGYAVHAVHAVSVLNAGQPASLSLGSAGLWLPQAAVSGSLSAGRVDAAQAPAAMLGFIAPLLHITAGDANGQSAQPGRFYVAFEVPGAAAIWRYDLNSQSWLPCPLIPQPAGKLACETEQVGWFGVTR